MIAMIAVMSVADEMVQVARASWQKQVPAA